MLRYGKLTLLEVETGIALVGIVGSVGCALVWGMFAPQTLGFLLGSVGAAALFYSMALSTETSLDLGDASAAKKHSRKMLGIRYVSIIFAALVISRIEAIDVVAALLALFSIKAAVYLQPVMHKLFCQWFNLKDELSPDALILTDDPEEDEDMDFIDRWLESKYKK